MEIAALLALGLQDWTDFGVIVGILLLNAFVGFYQEKQAADIVASLKGDIAMRCTVVRDGHESEILARELVPGDIVSTDETSNLSRQSNWHSMIHIYYASTNLTYYRSSSKKVTPYPRTPTSSVTTTVPKISKFTSASRQKTN